MPAELASPRGPRRAVRRSRARARCPGRSRLWASAAAACRRPPRGAARGSRAAAPWRAPWTARRSRAAAGSAAPPPPAGPGPARTGGRASAGSGRVCGPAAACGCLLQQALVLRAWGQGLMQGLVGYVAQQPQAVLLRLLQQALVLRASGRRAPGVTQGVGYGAPRPSGLGRRRRTSFVDNGRARVADGWAAAWNACTGGPVCMQPEQARAAIGRLPGPGGWPSRTALCA